MMSYLFNVDIIKKINDIQVFMKYDINDHILINGKHGKKNIKYIEFNWILYTHRESNSGLFLNAAEYDK